MTALISDHAFMRIVRKRLLLTGLLEDDYPIQRLDAITSILPKDTATLLLERDAKLTSVERVKIK